MLDTDDLGGLIIVSREDFQRAIILRVQGQADSFIVLLIPRMNPHMLIVTDAVLYQLGYGGIIVISDGCELHSVGGTGAGR